jgi:hypothetical protein
MVLKLLMSLQHCCNEFQSEPPGGQQPQSGGGQDGPGQPDGQLLVMGGGGIGMILDKAMAVSSG